MLCTGIAYRFRKGFTINIIQIAGNGNNYAGFPQIRDTDCFPEEILEHQFSNVKISNKSVPDRPDRRQPVRGTSKEESGFISYRLNRVAVITVKHNKGRFGDHNTSSPHIETDIFRSEINTDIRSPEWHKRIILYES